MGKQANTGFIYLCQMMAYLFEEQALRTESFKLSDTPMMSNYRHSNKNENDLLYKYLTLTGAFSFQHSDSEHKPFFVLHSGTNTL